MSENSTFNHVTIDWLAELGELSYANQKPSLKGLLKSLPEDFNVTEVMDVEPSGEGEHYWLDISKIKCNTEQVAKALAKFANVSPRDVGYSGMKDFFAETRQWFSVWKPKGGQPAWEEFKTEGVVVHRVVKHSRKIKRGTHRANKFKIVIRDIDGDLSELEVRLGNVKREGVPNYFGAQRFGRNADNIRQAIELFNGDKKIKSRQLKGILLSSARSWLFNQVVSGRVSQGSWQVLNENEPANLHATNSVFQTKGDNDEARRLKEFDIHPTGPMWGKGVEGLMSDCKGLLEWEQSLMLPYAVLQNGLEQAKLDYQRRALRCIASDVTWAVQAKHDASGVIKNHLVLSFELIRGQFATSVLRELVNVE